MNPNAQEGGSEPSCVNVEILNCGDDEVMRHNFASWEVGAEANVPIRAFTCKYFFQVIGNKG